MARAFVVGAGAFGTTAAIALAKSGLEVHLWDEKSRILDVASANNHNRLHLGYHYLRSPETAKQSLSGFLSFAFSYGDCVVTEFPNYYALSRSGSKTNASQFLQFCDSLGIPYVEEFPDHSLLNRNLVEACFRVPEPLINLDLFRSRLLHELTEASVFLHLGRQVLSAAPRSRGGFEIAVANPSECWTADILINATYGRETAWLNRSLNLSRDQRFEHVIIPVVRIPTPPVGLTLMDGLFGSVMPHASSPGESLVYHVRHSVVGGPYKQQPPEGLQHPNEQLAQQITTATAEYFPILRNATLIGHKKALRVIDNTPDDARVSELIVSERFPGYIRILSGKISTCIGVAQSLSKRLSTYTHG